MARKRKIEAMTDTFEGVEMTNEVVELVEAPVKRKRGASGPRQKPTFVAFVEFVDGNGNALTGVTANVLATVNKNDGKALVRVIQELGAARFATATPIDLTVA